VDFLPSPLTRRWATLRCVQVLLSAHRARGPGLGRSLVRAKEQDRAESRTRGRGSQCLGHRAAFSSIRPRVTERQSERLPQKQEGCVSPDRARRSIVEAASARAEPGPSLPRCDVRQAPQDRLEGPCPSRAVEGRRLRPDPGERPPRRIEAAGRRWTRHQARPLRGQTQLWRLRTAPSRGSNRPRLLGKCAFSPPASPRRRPRTAERRPSKKHTCRSRTCDLGCMGHRRRTCGRERRTPEGLLPPEPPQKRTRTVGRTNEARPNHTASRGGTVRKTPPGP
jgi:hypothetical protein